MKLLCSRWLKVADMHLLKVTIETWSIKVLPTRKTSKVAPLQFKMKLIYLKGKVLDDLDYLVRFTSGVFR